ncbi:Pal1 cell morphology protein-domain-containing protein [Lipomyces japonicus]|uniref:Pal1 cell morphology protein-domain-containing protein n=1 Tax=Lipomyces japonicus TaxID=56871 RepID=UPI0034CD1F80
MAFASNNPFRTSVHQNNAYFLHHEPTSPIPPPPPPPPPRLAKGGVRGRVSGSGARATAMSPSVSAPAAATSRVSSFGSKNPFLDVLEDSPISSSPSTASSPTASTASIVYLQRSASDTPKNNQLSELLIDLSVDETERSSPLLPLPPRSGRRKVSEPEHRQRKTDRHRRNSDYSMEESRDTVIDDVYRDYRKHASSSSRRQKEERDDPFVTPPSSTSNNSNTHLSKSKYNHRHALSTPVAHVSSRRRPSSPPKDSTTTLSSSSSSLSRREAVVDSHNRHHKSHSHNVESEKKRSPSKRPDGSSKTTTTTTTTTTTSSSSSSPPHKSTSTSSGSKKKQQQQQASMDKIDKLDVTGIFGFGFHHDGPFDACNPHRNVNSKKAPMLAFPADSENNSLRPLVGSNDDDDHGGGDRGGGSGSGSGMSHGDISLGLGSSTFLEGAPASQAAIKQQKLQQRAKEAADGRIDFSNIGGSSYESGAGLSRKKSIVQKLRGVSGESAVTTGASSLSLSSSSPAASTSMAPPQPPQRRRSADDRKTVVVLENDEIAGSRPMARQASVDESSTTSAGLLKRVRSLKVGGRRRVD